jgi:hypothetical protein
MNKILYNKFIVLLTSRLLQSNKDSLTATSTVFKTLTSLVPKGYQCTKDKVIPVRKPTRQRQYKQAKHSTNKEPNTIVAPTTEADQRGIAPEKNDNKAYQ